MAPPWPTGQMKADGESSTNGPDGLELVALEMHIAAVERLAVRMHPARPGL